MTWQHEIDDNRTKQEIDSAERCNNEILKVLDKYNMRLGNCDICDSIFLAPKSTNKIINCNHWSLKY